MVRQDWEFSNGAHCNTRSRWCWLKHSLSVCILNASQSKSNPVCATLVCSLTFPPPPPQFCRALIFWWEKAKHNHRKGHAWCENIRVIPSWLSLTLQSVSNPCWLNNEADARLRVKHNTISVWCRGTSVGIRQEFVRLKKDQKTLLRGSVKLFATLIALWQLKALNKSAPFQVTEAFSNIFSLLCQLIISNIVGNITWLKAEIQNCWEAPKLRHGYKAY